MSNAAVAEEKVEAKKRSELGPGERRIYMNGTRPFVIFGGLYFSPTSGKSDLMVGHKGVFEVQPLVLVQQQPDGKVLHEKWIQMDQIFVPRDNSIVVPKAGGSSTKVTK